VRRAIAAAVLAASATCVRAALRRERALQRRVHDLATECRTVDEVLRARVDGLDTDVDALTAHAVPLRRGPYQELVQRRGMAERRRVLEASVTTARRARESLAREERANGKARP
jgi:hypothetical protein